MLHLLPYKELELFSPFKSEEALEKLSSEIKPIEIRTGPVIFGTTDERFQGNVNGNHFEIRRDISYRNSFLPFIRGTIMPAGKGSVVRVEMRMHPAARKFMRFWLGVIAAMFLGMVLAAAGIACIVIPAFLIAFGVAFMMAGFYPEASIAKDFFCEALSAKDHNPWET